MDLKKQTKSAYAPIRSELSSRPVPASGAAGSKKSFFKGNGANLVKIAPETAMKLTLNDSIRHVIALDPDHVHVTERMISGGLAGAIAQVRHVCLYLYRLHISCARLVAPASAYALDMLSSHVPVARRCQSMSPWCFNLHTVWAIILETGRDP